MVLDLHLELVFFKCLRCAWEGTRISLLWCRRFFASKIFMTGSSYGRLAFLLFFEVFGGKGIIEFLETASDLGGGVVPRLGLMLTWASVSKDFFVITG